MTSELLIKQIETYSNAIVAFAVLQGLAFSYAFGTDAFFNCLVKTASNLAEGLTLLFVLVTLLSVFATVSIGRTLQQISGKFRGIVNKIYIGKLVDCLQSCSTKFDNWIWRQRLPKQDGMQDYRWTDSKKQVNGGSVIYSWQEMFR